MKKVLFVFGLFAGLCALFLLNSSSSALVLSPNDMDTSEQFLSNNTISVSSDNSEIYSGEVAGTDKLFFEKGDYRFTVSYKTDSNENYCKIYSNTEMDDYGEIPRIYVNSRLDEMSQEQSIELSFPHDTTNVQLQVYYVSGNLDISQIRIEKDKPYTDGIFLSVFFVVFYVALYYLLFYVLSGEKNKEEQFVISILLFTIVYSSIPLFRSYLYADNGQDVCFHVSRIEGVYESLVNNQFPMWINSFQASSNGYCSPVMYPQLFLYIPALFRMMGMSLMVSYKLFLFLINTLTVFGTFACIDHIVEDKKAGLIGAIAYSICIYRFCDVYKRGALGEMLAMAFLPIVIWGLYEIVNGNYKKWIIFVIGMTGMIQSHIITTFVWLLFALAYFLLQFLTKRNAKKERLVSLIKSSLFVILLNLGFLVPFVSFYRENFKVHETDFDQLQETGVRIGQLFRVFVDAGDNNSKTISLGGIFLIVILTYFTLLFVIILSKRPNENMKKIIKECSIFMVGALLAIVFSLKGFPWTIIRRIPGLSLLTSIQFPWRMYAFASIFLSISAAFEVKLLKQLSIKKFKIIYSIVVLLIFANSLFYLASLENLDKIYSKTELMLINTTDQLYAYVGDELTEVENRGNVVTVQDGVKAEITDFVKEGNRVSFNYSFPESSDIIEPTYIEIPLYFYPGYVTEINGEVAETTRGDNGIVRIYVDKSSGNVTTFFKAPKIWILAYFISCATFFLLVFSKIIQLQKGKLKKIKMKYVGIYTDKEGRLK